MLLGMMQKRKPDATVIVGGSMNPGDYSLSDKLKMYEDARDEAFGEYMEGVKANDVERARRNFQVFHEIEHYLMDMKEEMKEEKES